MPENADQLWINSDAKDQPGFDKVYHWSGKKWRECKRTAAVQLPVSGCAARPRPTAWMRRGSASGSLRIQPLFSMRSVIPLGPA